MSTLLGQAEDALNSKPGEPQQETTGPEPTVLRAGCEESEFSLLGNLVAFDCIQPPESPSSSSRIISEPKTTNAHPPQAAVQPDSIKRLKKYTREITRETALARTAFDVVEKTLGKMDLKSEDREKLQETWGDIRAAFEVELRNSNEVAIKARGTIIAFLNFVIPYLQGGHPRESKLKALAQYKETVTRGKEQASRTYNSFEGIRTKIKIFEAKCTSYVKIAAEEMTSAMASLRNEIDQLANGFRNVDGVFFWLCTRLEQSEATHPDSNYIPETVSRAKLSRKKRHLELKRNKISDQVKNVNGQKDTVTKNAKEVRSHIDGFAKIWRMVEDNVTAIEAGLDNVPVQFACSSASEEPRLSDLQRQYTGLMEALELYTKALSEGDRERLSLHQRFKYAFDRMLRRT